MRRRVLPRADSVQAGKSKTRSEKLLRIAILGDRLRGYAKHDTLETAIARAAAGRGLPVEISWLPSQRLTGEVDATLHEYDGLVAAPQSSEYCQYPEALNSALRFARHTELCCLSVCGGAQYALREHAGDLIGISADDAILSPVSCGPAVRFDDYPISGLRLVELTKGSTVAACYRRTATHEHFACSFRFDEHAGAALLQDGVSIVGNSPEIGATLFDWHDLPFYVAALFLPHWSPEEPHPLFTALLDCAREQRRSGLAALP